MANQLSMTFEQAINFDKAFVEQRLNECLSLIKFQVNRGLDGLPVNFELCAKASESFYNFFRHADLSNGFTVSERSEFMFCYFDLRDELEGLQNNEKVKPVPEPAPSAQLQVLRVLGQVSKAATEREKRGLSLLWFPTLVCFPAPAKLLSNTRSVGGLA